MGGETMNLWNTLEIIAGSYRLELLTSLISGVSCGLIGCFIILRRMALMGDALVHAILPGVVIAFMLGGTNPLILLVGAVIAGVVTSLVIGFVQNNSRVKEDSSIGLSFTFFFAIGVILISQLPRGTHFDLQCFLFGEPLAVQPSDLWIMLGIGIAVSLAILIFYRPLFMSTFDPVIAVCMGINVIFIHYLLMALLSATVVASLRAMGVIMVVAILIAPGATAYQLTDRLPTMLCLSAIFGGVAATLGFIVAFWLNWPAGPAMTVVAGLMFFSAMIFSPKYGAFFVKYRQWLNQRHILEEDILKSVVRRHPQPLALKDLEEHLGLKDQQVRLAIHGLSKKNLVHLEGSRLSLTGTGKMLAEEILRAHRLWERYLAENGVATEQVHQLAEIFEHAHEMADTIDKKLGLPATDPHGQQIPRPSPQEMPH